MPKLVLNRYNFFIFFFFEYKVENRKRYISISNVCFSFVNNRLKWGKNEGKEMKKYFGSFKV
jgi:hypothetical protein